MWGCLLAAAITFPLVWGWIHFETIGGRLDTYRTYLFGFPAGDLAIDSPIAFIVFHGLVWASFLVIAGVMLAFRRRMRDRGAEAVQQFGEDILPLVLLVRDQRHRPDADDQLHLAARLRLRASSRSCTRSR